MQSAVLGAYARRSEEFSPGEAGAFGVWLGDLLRDALLDDLMLVVDWKDAGQVSFMVDTLVERLATQVEQTPETRAHYQTLLTYDEDVSDELESAEDLLGRTGEALGEAQRFLGGYGLRFLDLSEGSDTYVLFPVTRDALSPVCQELRDLGVEASAFYG